MKSNDLITVDADILGGTPVFKGTRSLAHRVLESSEAALLAPMAA